MRIFTGSVNDTSNHFLHAGYVSAYPRSFGMMGSYQFQRANLEVLDVNAALRLKDSKAGALNSSVTTLTARPWSMAGMLKSAGSNRDIFLFPIVLAFFLFLAGLYYRRIRRSNSGWKTPATAVLPALLFVLLAQFIWPAAHMNSLPPPWQGAPVQEYADPDRATRVLLYGVIADGLAGCSFKVKNLSALQEEVGFPVKPGEMTPGMVYALKNYGRDGWGREFKFDSRHKISSAGPDGEHGTADDIRLTIRPATEDDWEHMVEGIYLRKSEKHFAVVLHRVAHSHFAFAYKDEARKAFGTDLYDMIPASEFGRGQFEDDSFLADALKVFDKENPATEEPLLFIRRTDKSKD
jgi:hypothetical protein